MIMSKYLKSPLKKHKNLEDFFKSKLIYPEDIEKGLEKIRKEGLTIATLNGSFDLLHAGHLTIIHEASNQADILLMLLNTDESIRKYNDMGYPKIYHNTITPKYP